MPPPAVDPSRRHTSASRYGFTQAFANLDKESARNMNVSGGGKVTCPNCKEVVDVKIESRYQESGSGANKKTCSCCSSKDDALHGEVEVLAQICPNCGFVIASIVAGSE